VADPRPIRVAFLDHTARWSGGEIALHTLLEAIEGVEPVLILAEDGPLRERVHALGIPVQVLPLGDEVREVRKDDVRPGRLPLRPAIATAGYVVRLARRLAPCGPTSSTRTRSSRRSTAPSRRGSPGCPSSSTCATASPPTTSRARPSACSSRSCAPCPTR
jgi:hypothetical protein